MRTQFVIGDLSIVKGYPGLFASPPIHNGGRSWYFEAEHSLETRPTDIFIIIAIFTRYVLMLSSSGMLGYRFTEDLKVVI